MKDRMEAIMNAVIDLDADTCIKSVKECLESGRPAIEIIDMGLSPGMQRVGELFEKGEYYLSELVMGGQVMSEVMETLESQFETSSKGNKKKVILATVKDDIHDLGKNIVGMMLSASGFEIIDLGIDVKAEKIAEAVKTTGAKGLGLTMLLTTAIENAREVVTTLEKDGLRDKVKIAIGGACTSEKLAQSIGVDAYGANAVQAVRIFERFLI